MGDGRTMCTDAFQRAIAACSASGGGTVHVPPGTYRSGPIALASHVNLHVGAGARIIFSRDFDDYPLIRFRWQGFDAASCTPPLYGRGLENVAITGEGTFDGSGDAWRPVKRFKLAPDAWEALVASGGVLSHEGEIWWPTADALAGHLHMQKLERAGAPVGYEDLARHRDHLRPVLLSSGCPRAPRVG